MGITYIVGARQSGKTSELLKYIKDTHTILYAPFVSMLRDAKNYPVIKGVASLDNVFKARGYDVVLCDEFQMVSFDAQYHLLKNAEHYNLVVTINPQALNINRIPPYWDFWGRAKVINLQSRMSSVQLRRFEKEVTAETFVTEFLGKFIVDPKG